MKKILVSLLSAVVLLVSCSAGPFKNGVAQEIDDHYVDPGKSGKSLGTYVWYCGNIMRVWNDDIDTITDSIVKLRQRQGDSLLNTLKDMK